ncbi:hypothetical protein AVEN_209135-1 [Araneus ventricosus]|uniref:Uncharacterized protein n=1 Tax=Araneus ventricosus TaxID=182803 RepID=A0A4Y2LM08_ARAVE|nr:hypothetical protein AVEN_209135-1 [Araneus ventricosus]
MTYQKFQSLSPVTETAEVSSLKKDESGINDRDKIPTLLENTMEPLGLCRDYVNPKFVCCGVFTVQMKMHLSRGCFKDILDLPLSK